MGNSILWLIYSLDLFYKFLGNFSFGVYVRLVFVFQIVIFKLKLYFFLSIKTDNQFAVSLIESRDWRELAHKMSSS